MKYTLEKLMPEEQCVCDKYTENKFNKNLIDDLSLIYINKCYMSCKNKANIITKINEMIQISTCHTNDLVRFIYNTLVYDNFNIFLLKSISLDKFTIFMLIFDDLADILEKKTCLEILLLSKCNLDTICEVYISMQDFINPGDYYCSPRIQNQVEHLFKYLVLKKYNPSVSYMYMLALTNKLNKINDTFTQFQFSNSISDAENMFDLINLFENKLFKNLFTNTNLDKYVSIDILRALLDNKIIPSDKFVDNITLSLCYLHNYCWRYKYTNLLFETIEGTSLYKETRSKKDVSNYYNLLRLYGYNINMDQLCLLAKNNLFVSNLDDYQLDLKNEKLINILTESGTGLYDDKIISVRVRNLCKNKITLAVLAGYEKYLDKTCLINSFDINKLSIIKFIVEKGNVKVDLECLKEAIYGEVSKDILKYLVDILYNPGDK